MTSFNSSFAFPTKDEIVKELKNKSNWLPRPKLKSLTFADTRFGEEGIVSISVENIHLNGEWLFVVNDLPETAEYELRMLSRNDTKQSVIMNFPTAAQRKVFVESLTVEKKIEQVSNGMDLETVVNTTAGKQVAVGAVVLGTAIALYRLARMKRHKIVKITKERKK